VDDIRNLIDNGTINEICQKVGELSTSTSPDALSSLTYFLTYKSNDTYGKHIIPRIACRAFFRRGREGVETLYKILNEIDGSIYPQCIIRSLWKASQGIFDDLMLNLSEFPETLVFSLSQETIIASKSAFYEIVKNSQLDYEIFNQLMFFLYNQGIVEYENNHILQKQFFNIIFESSIKISKSLIDDYKNIIEKCVNEEQYQIFFEQNPVFLNPLSSQVIGKHKLGSDLITDFVIKTLTNNYILVEIEKPHDAIFNKNGNFSANFTHAYGQILDFIDWIESNIAYAQSKLPGIISPKGLLIIGRSKGLSQVEKKKLMRFNNNSKDVEVLTYDDILSGAISLYNNIKNCTQI
jgi:hypothetical protein